MKKIYLITILFLSLQFSTSAQTAEHCDGVRYLTDIFEPTVTSAVEYGENIDVLGNDMRLFMDIYEPEGDTQEMRPLVIFAHGGSFIFGSRGDMDQACRDFASKGYVAATIDYRKWNISLGFPDSTQMLDIVVNSNFDMKAAIRFFRQDAATTNNYRIDPDMIIAGGLSAGGIMAVQAGIMDETDNIPDFVRTVIENNTVDNNFEGTSGNPGYSSEVQGIINWSGGLYRVDWLDANDPPIVSMHGTNDGTVPFLHGLAANIMSINGSGLIHPQAEAMGVTNYLIEVQGGDHTDIYTDAQFVDAQDDWDLNGYKFVEEIVCNLTSTNSLSITQPQVYTYPNPASDNMNIYLDNYQSNYDLYVFDNLGRTMLTSFDNSDNLFELKRSDLGQGMFFVNIVFQDKAIPTVTKRIVFE